MQAVLLRSSAGAGPQRVGQTEGQAFKKKGNRRQLVNIFNLESIRAYTFNRGYDFEKDPLFVGVRSEPSICFGHVGHQDNATTTAANSACRRPQSILGDKQQASKSPSDSNTHKSLLHSS